MVLINETKYACQSCIKGHRTSSCLHHDRPLFEVAKKGRPVKQCEHCRELRKNKAVHVKCVCSTATKKETAEGSATPEAGPTEPKAKTKRKDVTLGPPALPNGLKDVHDMALAAEVLNGLGTGTPTNRSRVDDLLNPCACLTGGDCSCCAPRKKPAPAAPPSAAGPVHPLSIEESLASPPLELDRPSAARSASSSGGPSRRTSVSGSAHAHKTPLYSPYPAPAFTPTGSRISIRSSVAPDLAVGTSTPEAVLRQGLKDLVSNYMKAKQDRVQSALVNFSFSTGQPSGAGGLASAGAGDIREEDERIEEVLMVSTCTCGDDCACPSCKEHGNAPADGMDVVGGEHQGCGDNCSSCFACSSQLAMPANLSTKAAMQTVADLLAASSSKLPPPPVSARPYDLDPLNLSVLPPSAFLGGDESRAAFGLMQVPRLECCTGRCKCPPGECSCMSDCCGCCDKCLCDEDEDEAVLTGADAAHAVPVKSSSVEPPPQAAKSSCCSTKAEIIEDDIPPPPPATIAVPAPPVSSCCAPAPAPAKKSCCAPAPPSDASTSSAGVVDSAKSAGKKACGGGSCGGKTAQAAPRLRTLLPKPSVGVAPVVARRGSSASRNVPAVNGAAHDLPNGNARASSSALGVDSSTANAGDLNGGFALPSAFSPNSLGAFLDASRGPPELDQFDFSQPFDPSLPAISDAELDELMATLAAANGGNLDGLSWEAALAPQPFAAPSARPSYSVNDAFASSIDSPFASHEPALPSPCDYMPQPPVDPQQQFDLRAFVDSFSPLPQLQQPEPSSPHAQFGAMFADGQFDGADQPPFADFEMPDAAALGEMPGVDWSTLLASTPPA